MKLNPRPLIPFVLVAALLIPVGCMGGGSSGNNGNRSTRSSLEEVIAADEATQRAKLLMASGRLREALDEFERAVELDPRSVDARIGIGDVYKEEGDLPRAERWYGQAAQVGPDVFEAQYAHGLVLQLMQRFREAIRAYLRALQIDPRNFDANMNVALAFVQVGEPQQGLPYAVRAVRLNPESGPANYNLGVVYSSVGRHDDAITSYRRASEYMGTSPQILMGIADSESALGRYTDSARTMERLLATDPSADAYHRLGSARFRNKEYEASLAAFRKALEYDENHTPALNGVSVCLLNQYLWSEKTDTQALEAAIRAMRRSLRINRNQPKITELLTRFG
ncbi:MAG: hypothetical protein Phyf2KO_01300 [Phycisphaerales bacterium]